MEEASFQHNVVPRLKPTEQVLVRSQRGLMAGIPFFCPRVSCAWRFLSASVCSYCAGFGVLSPCRPLSAGVASHLTLVAITGQFVRSGVLGRRGYPFESCAARVCREAGARVSTNLRVGWQMVYRCSMGHSWPWTPRWSAQSEKAVRHHRRSTLEQLAAGKNSDTLNSLVNKIAPDLWCWRVRLGDDGLRKHKTF